jgi:hypothetical protein
MIGNVSHSAIQFDSVNFGSVSHHRKGKMPSYNGRFGLDVLASVPQIAMHQCLRIQLLRQPH